jgi:hypothetical protein
MNLRTMPKEEFRRTVRLFARQVARQEFQKANPGATELQIDSYVGRYWELHVETALDWLALIHLAGETEAAHSN